MHAKVDLGCCLKDTLLAIVCKGHGQQGTGAVAQYLADSIFRCGDGLDSKISLERA
jgi:hypothetical protein